MAIEVELVRPIPLSLSLLCSLMPLHESLSLCYLINNKAELAASSEMVINLREGNHSKTIVYPDFTCKVVVPLASYDDCLHYEKYLQFCLKSCGTLYCLYEQS